MMLLRVLLLVLLRLLVLTSLLQSNWSNDVTPGADDAIAPAAAAVQLLLAAPAAALAPVARAD